MTQPQLTINPTTNRITTGGYQYDAAGNLTADGTGNTYSYDAENRIKAVNSGTTASYSYDGHGLRVLNTAGGTTTAYVFSGSKVIAEYAGGTLSARYVYAGSQLLATITGGTTYHYADHLSARMETNPSGTVTRTFGHLPFGETWYETGTAMKWKFTSYERDSESGLDDAMARYESSRLGRFMTADPLGGSPWGPQSLDRYPYVENDPVNLIDPKGQDDYWACFLDVTSNGHCGGTGPVGGGGPIGGRGWGNNFWLGYSEAEARFDQILATGIDPWTTPTGSGWRAPGEGDPELRALGCLVNEVTDQTWCPGTGVFLHDPTGTIFILETRGGPFMDQLHYPKKTRTNASVSAVPARQYSFSDRTALCATAVFLSNGPNAGTESHPPNQAAAYSGGGNFGSREINPEGLSFGEGLGGAVATAGAVANCVGGTYEAER